MRHRQYPRGTPDRAYPGQSSIFDSQSSPSIPNWPLWPLLPSRLKPHLVLAFSPLSFTIVSFIYVYFSPYHLIPTFCLMKDSVLVWKLGWTISIIDMSTELWRHVNLPWSRATEQLERTCARVWILPQKGHLSLTLFPHLFKCIRSGFTGILFALRNIQEQYDLPHPFFARFAWRFSLQNG